MTVSRAEQEVVAGEKVRNEILYISYMHRVALVDCNFVMLGLIVCLLSTW